MRDLLQQPLALLLRVTALGLTQTLVGPFMGQSQGISPGPAFAQTLCPETELMLWEAATALIPSPN